MGDNSEEVDHFIMIDVKTNNPQMIRRANGINPPKSSSFEPVLKAKRQNNQHL